MIVKCYYPGECSFLNDNLKEEEIQELILEASSKKDQKLLMAIFDSITKKNVTKIGGKKGDWKMSLSRFP